MTQTDNNSYVSVAVHCAQAAGEWIKNRVGRHRDTRVKTGLRDLVTEVDQGAEAMIRRLLKLHFPDHAVLGEEEMEPGAAAYGHAIRQAKAATYVWIVDPIDGTTNFVHGFPFFSVSIALAHKGEIVVGVVYDPLKAETFVAEKGKGAVLGNHPLSVSRETRLDEALVASGWDIESAFEFNRRSFQQVMPLVRNMRLGGSAALHLAYVAAGRLSGYWEFGLQAWDMAAGILLVQEAGGCVTDHNGRPYKLDMHHVVATNGFIHQHLIDAVGGCTK